MAGDADPVEYDRLRRLAVAAEADRGALREPRGAPDAERYPCPQSGAPKLFSGLIPSTFPRTIRGEKGAKPCEKRYRCHRENAQEIRGIRKYHASLCVWHASLYRREPDPGNANYWFRHVGPHPIAPELAAAALARGDGDGTTWDAARVVTSTTSSRRP